MEYNKEILVKDYFDIHDHYSNIYGINRTIILMQVGSFHEVYCTNENSKHRGLKLESLSQELDIHLAKKNDNIRMMGFPIHVTSSYIDKLIDMNYTVVLIDQVSEPPNPIRKVTSIYSPATRIEKNTKKAQFLVSIVLDRVKDMKSSNYNLCIGMAAYDMATGIGSVYETYTNSNDNTIGLDDAVRFMENYPPREIVLENNLNDIVVSEMTPEDILSYLGIEPGNTYNITKPEQKKIAYQKNLLEQIYKLNNKVDILEYIGLDRISWARHSLVILLDYVKAHQPNLLCNLKVPTLFNSSKYLYLGNRALDQLNVNNNENSLFNIINYTKTALGKRYLNCMLTMPLIDITELNKRYNIIDKIYTGNHMNKICDFLEDIYDIDKIIRKLEINIISPAELYQLYISFYQINKLNAYLKENKLIKDFDINDENMAKDVCNFIEKYFILDKIQQNSNLLQTNFMESDHTLYNNKIHMELDTLQDSIEVSQNFMSYLIKALEGYIDEKVYFKKNNDEEKSLISLKFNERDGHYLMMTTRRCTILKKGLEKVKKIKINNSIEINTSDLEFSELPKSSNTKINCTKIKEISAELINMKVIMAKKLKEYFKNDMKEFLEKFGKCLHYFSSKIAYIDYINSGAICAMTNHYSKPIISNTSASFFKATEMRHPLVEKIATDTVYVPHDIEIGTGTDQDGILLYGINSSGKSTLMKAIGLNLILAQIGYYTATTKFIYSPYHSIFTRICGNDNMFKGLSSFMVEMMELMAILKRNTMNTLVIGDELAKGTEFRSGIVIVSYMLEKLAQTRTSFITATHIHDINKLESIKKLDRVKTKHLKITHDPINDRLVYERSLLDGQGETFYGLMVAKHLMKDKTFNERTTELLKEYDNLNNNIIDKTSKYNSNVYVEQCTICDSTSNLETHHIVWQKDFNKDNINNKLFYLQKNDKSNLVVLCMKCHDKVDRNEIIVNGWLDTSEGRVFDYKIVTPDVKEKKKKYNMEIINHIKSMKGTYDSKMIRIKIKEKFDMKISTKSIEELLQ
jgi:DNA mismatch repair protein MutS